MSMMLADGPRPAITMQARGPYVPQCRADNETRWGGAGPTAALPPARNPGCSPDPQVRCKRVLP